MSENRQNDPGRSGWKQRSLEGFFGLVGPMWTKREGDSWAYGLVVEAQHTNPAGIIHGGALMTLIDHALSAIAWEAAQRRPCVTVQLDVQFVAAVRPAKLVEARGRVVKRAASLVFMQGNLTVEGEEVVTANAILKVIEARRSAAEAGSGA